jgi:hypothetical protein
VFDAFEAHYEGWQRCVSADPVRSTANSHVAISAGPDFDAIVALGTVAIPLILDKMDREDEIFLNIAMSQITGDTAPGACPSHVPRRDRAAQRELETRRVAHGLGPKPRVLIPRRFDPGFDGTPRRTRDRVTSC